MVEKRWFRTKRGEEYAVQCKKEGCMEMKMVYQKEIVNKWISTFLLSFFITQSPKQREKESSPHGGRS